MPDANPLPPQVFRVVITSMPAGFVGESWVAMPIPGGQHLNLQPVYKAPPLRTEAAVLSVMRALAAAYHFTPASIVCDRLGE